MRNTSQIGFTLIEIAIVLVIIGLIVAGILVGQNLISASQVRAQATQFEKYNQAVNTFRTKYNCFPGDCANPTVFFPSASITVAGMGTVGGNGDGLITDAGNTTVFPYDIQGEPTWFWTELFAAGLTDCCSAAAIPNGQYNMGQAFPVDRLGTAGIGTGALNSVNGYFWGISANSTSILYDLLSPNSSSPGIITPQQAQAFDAKIDDGQATTGNVFQAVDSGGDGHIHPFGYHAGYNCVTNTTPPQWNITYGGKACTLWINVQGGD